MFKSIAILGAGTMGRGIALFCAQKGINTRLYDPLENALASARKKFTGQLNLQFTSDLEEAIGDADLVIESAPEDLQIKKKLYSDLAPFIRYDAIVASNTSTYPLAELSEGHPFSQRMLILHFFYPADIVPLVEIVKTGNTRAGLSEKLALFLSDCGKVPVVLKRDIHGFIANRLQAAVLREACHLMEQGIAGPEEIDTVMKESIGIRWALAGPFEIADYGGLDIWEKVLKNLLPVLNNSTEVPEILSSQVVEHKLGLKTGCGFFKYDQEQLDNLIEARNQNLQKIIKIRKDNSC